MRMVEVTDWSTSMWKTFDPSGRITFWAEVALVESFSLVRLSG